MRFEGEDYLGRYRSSDWAERGFCKSCGTTLFYFLFPTQQDAMSVGAFDDHSAFRLVREVFIDRKPAGCELASSPTELSTNVTLVAKPLAGAISTSTRRSTR